jgi:hypothetical protein
MKKLVVIDDEADYASPNGKVNQDDRTRISDGSICFHPASEFGGKSKTYTDDEIRQIRRKKNIFANSEFSRGPRPSARHHLKIYFNQYGDARLFYKINGHSVKFIQNRR